jgi:hypothetical protein
MSGTAGSPATRRDPMVIGVILIAVGAIALIGQLVPLPASLGSWIVLAIGLAFLGAAVATRRYGLLVPGGIMTGLGAGIVASEALAFATDEATGGVITLGLGLGFVSIWVIGILLRAEPNHWWPLVPGGILTAVGGALVIGGRAIDLLDYWGVIAIAVGVLVIWRALADGRTRA